MEKLKKLDKCIYTVIACLLVWIFGTICMDKVFAHDKAMGVLMVMFCFLLYFFYVYRSRRNEDRALLHLALLFGFLVRVIYIWATSCYVSAHDLGWITDSGEITTGHLGYIGYIYHYGKIPDVDPRSYWSFCNPPVYYIISTIWLKLNTALGITWNQAVENLQILPLLYTSLSVVVFEKILDEISIAERVKQVLIALWGTFPILIWFSGDMATDSLVLLFALLIMLYTIRWYKRRDTKTIVILALCIGFGMITKISLGLFAVSVGTVFLIALIEYIRKDRNAIKKCVLQFAIFLAICAPIGLSWTVRNSVRFGIEADYVQDVGGEYSGQYVGNLKIWERLGIPSAEQWNYGVVQFNTEIDTNIWMTLFRTALYDEGQAFQTNSEGAEFIATFVLHVNIILAMGMLILWVCAIFQKKEIWQPAIRIFFVLTYAVYLFSYIRFNYDYPQICTMNFRYISFLMLIPMIGTGVWLKDKKDGVAVKVLSFVCLLANGLANLLYIKYCMFM